MKTTLIKKPDDTNAIYRSYRKEKLVTFPFQLHEDENGKKRLTNMRLSINNLTTSLTSKFSNGYGMRMGLEIAENKFLIGLDIDNTQDSGDVLNG